VIRSISFIRLVRKHSFQSFLGVVGPVDASCEVFLLLLSLPPLALRQPATRCLQPLRALLQLCTISKKVLKGLGKDY
jgi:hypothetical protein